jgi:hypothetical protein
MPAWKYATQAAQSSGDSQRQSTTVPLSSRPGPLPLLLLLLLLAAGPLSRRVWPSDPTLSVNPRRGNALPSSLLTRSLPLLLVRLLLKLLRLFRKFLLGGDFA